MGRKGSRPDFAGPKYATQFEIDFSTTHSFFKSQMMLLKTKVIGIHFGFMPVWNSFRVGICAFSLYCP